MAMMDDANDLASAKKYLKDHANDKKFKNKRFGDSYAFESNGKRHVLSNGLVSNGKVFNADGSSRNAKAGEVSKVKGIFSGKATRLGATKTSGKSRKASTGRSSG